MLVGAPARPNESLVVKACGPERRRPVDHSSDIKTQRGPAANGSRIERGGKLKLRSAHDREGPCSGADLDEAIRFLDAAGKNPARPMKLETAGEDANAVREERGGQGVARDAPVPLALKAKLEGTRAINALAALSQAVRLRAHRDPAGYEGLGAPIG